MVKIEVPTTMASWGAARKLYRPGIYEVTDERIIAAARSHGQVRVIEDEVEEGPYPDNLEDSSGTLTRGDLQAVPQVTACPLCGTTAKGEKGVRVHLQRVHSTSLEAALEATKPVETAPAEEAPAAVCPSCSGTGFNCDDCDGTGRPPEPQE